MPSIGFGPALAGTRPAQTTPAINAVLNKMERIYSISPQVGWPPALYAWPTERARAHRGIGLRRAGRGSQPPQFTCSVPRQRVKARCDRGAGGDPTGFEPVTSRLGI